MALFDAAFPLRVASAFRHEDNEIFGFLAMSCATIGEAFDRTLQYSRLYTVGALYEMDVDRDATRITWLPWPGDLGDAGYRAAMDYHLANMEQAIRQLGASPPRPVEVRLRHAAPPDAAAYSDFYGVAPRFGAPRYELVYPASLRDVGVTTFNSRLRDYFDQECRRMIEKLGAATSVAAQVRRALIGVMDGGDSSIDAVAKRLAISTRSLQRRLAEEGTSYNDLLHRRARHRSFAGPRSRPPTASRVPRAATASVRGRSSSRPRRGSPPPRRAARGRARRHLRAAASPRCPPRATSAARRCRSTTRRAGARHPPPAAAAPRSRLAAARRDSRTPTASS